MKITSSKPETGILSPDTNNPMNSSEVPNEAAFDQLFQLMFANANATKNVAPPEVAEVNADVVNQNNTDPLMLNVIDSNSNSSFRESADIQSQDIPVQDSANDINSLMTQLSNNGITNEQLDVASQDVFKDIFKKVSQDAFKDIPKDVSQSVVKDTSKDVLQTIPKNISESVSPDILKNIPEGFSQDTLAQNQSNETKSQSQEIASKIDKSPKNENEVIGTAQDIKLNTAEVEKIIANNKEIVQKDDKNNVNLADENANAITQAEIKQVMKQDESSKLVKQPSSIDQLANLTMTIKATADEKHPVKILPKIQQGDQDEKLSTSTTLNELNPSQFASLMASSNIAGKAKVEQHNKVIDAFVNIGELINSRTLQLVNANQAPSTGAPMSSQVSSQPLFDPMRDLKFEISTPGAHLQLGESYDAKIKIYPPELGNVIAKLKVGKDGSQLVILTENNHVKQIVEANLPLLKQQFQQADIQLTQVDVKTNQNDGNWNENNQQNNEALRQEQSKNDLPKADLSQNQSKVNKDAIIDTYA